MGTIVQKYGGTSVAGPAEIKRVARRIVATAQEGNKVCVVVSAMGDTTDRLIALAQEVSSDPHPREQDMLLTSGERISIALVSMAINDLGREAVSFTGSQAGIVTDTRHGQGQDRRDPDRTRPGGARGAARSRSSPDSRASRRAVT